MACEDWPFPVLYVPWAQAWHADTGVAGEYDPSGQSVQPWMVVMPCVKASGFMLHFGFALQP